MKTSNQTRGLNSIISFAKIKQSKNKYLSFLILSFLTLIFTTNLNAQTQPFWGKNGNTGAGNDFFGTTNQFPLIFKTNNTVRMQINSDSTISFMNNKLLDISFIDVDSINITKIHKLIIDSLFVTKKLKFGTNCIEFRENHIFTTEEGEDLMIQSREEEEFIRFKNNTILNLYSGNVGIGTDNPKLKLHVRHYINMESHQATGELLLPNRNAADTTSDMLNQISLDDDIFNEEVTGSMRLETEVFKGSSSIWDIHPSANYKTVGSQTHRLMFTDAINNHTVLTLVSNGFVGIGTLVPRQKLHVYNGNILISAENGKSSSLLFNNGSQGSSNWGNFGIEYMQPNVIEDNKGGLNFWRPFGSVGGHKNFVMHIANDGFVGIGTGKPMHKLDVCGTIRATVEIMVDANGAYCWPDFVFKPDYNLEPFAKRIETIKEQKHLPNVPSETQVAEEGIPVTETMRGILQNVEELYLYMEIMQERIQQLEEENKKLLELINQ